MAPSIQFGSVTEADFDELLALRLETMRESFERIDRFDPDRAATRSRESFRARETRRIVVDHRSPGCVGFWPEPVRAMRIGHFYMRRPVNGWVSALPSSRRS